MSHGGSGGTRPTEPEAERSRAQRSAPDLPGPCPGQPAMARTGSRRTEQRGDRRDLVPGAGGTRLPGRLRAVIQSMPLHLALPTGFDSWAQVLTDWRVSRAFDASPLPRCWSGEPELAVPFVAAISREICSRQLRRPPVALLVERQRVVESTFEKSGGPAYLELREAMDAGQRRYFAGLRAEHGGRLSSLDLRLPDEVGRLQTAFEASRQRHTPAVEIAQRAAAHAYWKTHPRHGIADDFFNDAADDSIPTRMARIDPAWWWRSFFTRLQAKSQRHHAAEGRLLDALPSLRVQARKTTLAAQIARWGETAAAEWGWRGGTHYRRLADYADKKAVEVVAWFEQRAPGYLGTPTVRQSLDARLHQFLAKHDPHARLLAAERDRLSEHWRN